MRSLINFKRYAAGSLIALLLILPACSPRPRPSKEPGGGASAAPTSTPTPTAAPGGPTEPTPEPQEGGYAFEFTHQVASELATLHALAFSCSGMAGPWQGNFDVELQFADIQIGGGGTFDFTVPEDSRHVEGEAPFSGSGTVSDSSCVIQNVSDPLRYEITFSEDGGSVGIIMGSIGGGTITAQCRDDPPITIPFAVAWGPDPLTAPITSYSGCP